jgi:hypothetical protein
MFMLEKFQKSATQLIGGLEGATGEALLISREEYTALLLQMGLGRSTKDLEKGVWGEAPRI